MHRVRIIVVGRSMGRERERKRDQVSSALFSVLFRAESTASAGGLDRTACGKRADDGNAHVKTMAAVHPCEQEGKGPGSACDFEKKKTGLVVMVVVDRWLRSGGTSEQGRSNVPWRRRREHRWGNRVRFHCVYSHAIRSSAPNRGSDFDPTCFKAWICDGMR